MVDERPFVALLMAGKRLAIAPLSYHALCEVVGPRVERADNAPTGRVAGGLDALLELIAVTAIEATSGRGRLTVVPEGGSGAA